MMGKPIKYGLSGLTGITMGWADELTGEGEQLIKIRVWYPEENRYCDFDARPCFLNVLKGEDVQDLAMSKGDWERIPEYVTMAMDLALETKDFKWAARLQRLGQRAEKEVKRIEAERAAQEAAAQPKPKVVRKMNRKVNLLGMTVKDTRTNKMGVVIAYDEKHPGLCYVNFYDAGLKKYVKHIRDQAYLTLVTDQAAINRMGPVDAEYTKRYLDTAGEISVNTLDFNWFHAVHSLNNQKESKKRKEQ